MQNSIMIPVQYRIRCLAILLMTSCFAVAVEAGNTDGADVIAVKTGGMEGAYSFTVTIKSPDTGCDQYANWWEVLSEDGQLLSRRILFHSHAGEQPFSRSGGPVSISANEKVWVRAHMNNSGYGGQMMTGSVTDGFQKARQLPDLPPALEKAAPQPGACAF